MHVCVCACVRSGLLCLLLRCCEEIATGLNADNFHQVILIRGDLGFSRGGIYSAYRSDNWLILVYNKLEQCPSCRACFIFGGMPQKENFL